MNQINENNDEEGAAAPPPPPCLKLVDDCWENIFDNLSPNDIVQMSSTCTDLMRVAGNYLKDYCSEMEFTVKRKEIVHFDNKIAEIEKDFYPYINKLLFEGENFEQKAEFLHSIVIRNNFVSLKSIEFSFITLYQPDFHSFRQVFENVESVKLNFCKILSPSIFTTISKYATNLKHLSVKNSTHGLSLFHQKYEKLEYLEYESYSMTDIQIENLTSFLQNHTKLKRFNTDYFGLWANKNAVENSSINLDVLGVSFSQYAISLEPLMEISNELIQLYVSGLFKHLSLSINYTLFSREVELIREPIIHLARSVSIKELHLNKIKGAYFDFFAYELPNLEYLNIDSVYNTCEIVEFVRLLKNLKTIKLSYVYKDEIHAKLLNSEREKLQDGKKITLHVPNRNYLYAKSTFSQLKFSKLDIARIEKKIIN